MACIGEEREAEGVIHLMLLRPPLVSLIHVITGAISHISKLKQAW